MKLDTAIHLMDWLYLLRAAGLTVWISLIALLIGTIAGFVVGIARTSKSYVFNTPATVYVTLIRGTPLLMQLFILYYVLPLLGINMPKFVTAIMGLSIYATAYLAEIVKSGLEAVDIGQREAARTLGLRPWQEFRYVVLPQALGVIVPPAFGFFIALIKDSSLVSIIGYIELTKAARLVIARTFKPFTLYIGAALIYFLICYSLSRFETSYLRSRFLDRSHRNIVADNKGV